MSIDLIGDEGQAVPSSVRMLHNNMYIALNKNWPKWAGAWLIRIDINGGVVDVLCPPISGEMGFRLKIVDVDPGMRTVVKNAGELLERYDIARGKGIAIRDAIRGLKFNGIGQAKYDE
tara:strand:- start:460 stop:813 length:354 start_codon:yes stop_codon:yes gene_type:complete